MINHPPSNRQIAVFAFKKESDEAKTNKSNGGYDYIFVKRSTFRFSKVMNSGNF